MAGFLILFVFAVPSHYRGLGIGVAILAYTLGLRHAFDADHISAIDNTTRKVLADRTGTGQPRPFGFGFFFSLGHSTIVVVIGAGIIVAEKTVFAAVSDSGSGLERFGGFFGTIVSASFLFLIGLLNLVILAGIVRIFASMRRGEYDEAELEHQLANRGLFYRFFGRWMNLAYGWAFFNPVRKVYYNLAITGLSVAICFFIGGIETLSLFPQEIKGLSRDHGFWALVSRFNLNTAGFVIVGMFIVTWLAALLIWRYGRIEERWGARLQPASPELPAPGLDTPDPAAIP